MRMRPDAMGRLPNLDLVVVALIYRQGAGDHIHGSLDPGRVDGVPRSRRPKLKTSEVT